VIILTRLNGPEFALNPDLIERADVTPDTVITLVDGTKYIIAETLTELARRIREFRASIIFEAQRFEPAHRTAEPTALTLTTAEETVSTVVPLHRRER
jgi:flagellar protein FlbD